MSVNLVAVLSGGLDSAVALAKVWHETNTKSEEIQILNVSYGSRHNVHEQHAARSLAHRWDIRQFHTLNLYQPMTLASVLAGKEESALMLSSPTAVPEGHYEEESMRQTVVPGRNLLFLSAAAAAAEAIARREGHRVALVVGIHQGDHHIYPDCRPAFFQAAKTAIHESSEGRVLLLAPLLEMSKVEVVKIGHELGVPFELLRTCYTTDLVACGRCGACRERLEAFEKNGLKDPIQYQGAK